jgi:hypothetical protein
MRRTFGTRASDKLNEQVFAPALFLAALACTPTSGARAGDTHVTDIGPKDAIMSPQSMEASRASLTYWSLSSGDVLGLRALARRTARERGYDDLARRLDQYYCQYVGLLRDDRIVWVTCRCEVGPNWRDTYTFFEVESGNCFVEICVSSTGDVLSFSSGPDR